MQRHCSELTDRLLQSVDEDHNVVNMQGVLEVIQALEKIVMSKEVLEATRLGKHINAMRKKITCDRLARRAKDLLRKWRDELEITAKRPTATDTGPQPVPAVTNGTQCPALRGIEPQSPALRGLKPASPLLKPTSLSRVSSPGLSLHSDQSRSPIVSPCKPQLTASSNCKANLNTLRVEGQVCIQNHLQEAVPRTHSSNKRLRKDNQDSPEVEFVNKKPRLNGESVNSSITNSQVPSPTLKERNPELVEPSVDIDGNVVKKRGRKKGSKSVKKALSAVDSVHEKLASITRNPKLKTTQELLADLQARGSNVNANSLPSHSVNAPNINDVVRTKNDVQVDKYLAGNQTNSVSQKGNAASNVKLESSFPNASHRYHESDTADEDTRDSIIPSENRSRLPQDFTVEEILAKLPPLDTKSIDWNDDYYDQEIEDSDKPKEVTEEDLERLHTECVEGLNGNFQPKLQDFIPEISDTTETCENEVKFDGVVGLRRPSDSHKDEIFREWHEMLARPTSDGQILHILPYVIID